MYERSLKIPFTFGELEISMTYGADVDQADLRFDKLFHVAIDAASGQAVKRISAECLNPDLDDDEIISSVRFESEIDDHTILVVIRARATKQINLPVMKAILFSSIVIPVSEAFTHDTVHGYEKYAMRKLLEEMPDHIPARLLDLLQARGFDLRVGKLPLDDPLGV